MYASQAPSPPAEPSQGILRDVWSFSTNLLPNTTRMLHAGRGAILASTEVLSEMPQVSGSMDRVLKEADVQLSRMTASAELAMSNADGTTSNVERHVDQLSVHAHRLMDHGDAYAAKVSAAIADLYPLALLGAAAFAANQCVGLMQALNLWGFLHWCSAFAETLPAWLTELLGLIIIAVVSSGVLFIPFTRKCSGPA
eukprot:EG_transcript_25546